MLRSAGKTKKSFPFILSLYKSFCRFLLFYFYFGFFFLRFVSTLHTIKFDFLSNFFFVCFVFGANFELLMFWTVAVTGLKVGAQGIDCTSLTQLTCVDNAVCDSATGQCRCQRAHGATSRGTCGT